MPQRRDANRLALRAARAILDAATDLRLDVDGTPVDVQVTRLPSMPWPHLPAEGQDVLDEATEGPWPGAVQAECTWKGGSRTLLVRADFWARTSGYAHLLALSVSLAESRQQLIWMSLAGALREAVDGTECALPALVTLYKRKEGAAEGAPSALKAAVARSGLPLLSASRVEMFRVRVPGAEVLPSPAEAFRRLIHLALLKLPYLVRPESGTWGEELPWFRPSVGPAPEDAPPESGKLSRLSALPGGVRQYKRTLEELLEWLAAAPRSVQDFEKLLGERYGASGARAQQGYRRVLINLGLMEETGGALDLTERGQAYLTSRDALLLFDWLHASYQGVLAALVIAEAPGGAGTRETHRLLKALLDLGWRSHGQTNLRQNWLLSLGLTERTPSGDVLTNLGHEALLRHGAEAAELRSEVAELREELAAELGEHPELDEDVLDEDGEELPRDSEAPTAPRSEDEAEPAGWSADRLDLTAAQVRPHLGTLELPAGVLEQVCAALSAGKHLLLIGPPGTGKTELAHALAQAARTEGYCRGLFEATASADWTTYETIGGYALERDKSLRFRAGAFLRAVESWQWLLVDELNRADVDKAFGELMTVLGGRGTDTPFELEGGRRVSIGFDAGRTHRISRTFRVIATMNTWDKTSLFRLSYAVQRRFAVVNLGIPSDEAYARLLSGAALGPGPDSALDEPTVRRLTQLFQRRGLLAWRDIGPAIALDMVRYMRRRAASGDGLAEALGMFLLPQLEGLDPESARSVYGLFLSALTGWTSEAALQELRGRCADVWPPGSLPEA